MNSYRQTKSRCVHIGLAVMLSVVLLFAVMLLTMPTVHAAEEDVTTWTTIGECEWGIDQEGCLWIRPINGVYGEFHAFATYGGVGNGNFWRNYSDNILSVVVKGTVKPVAFNRMFENFSNCVSMDLSGLDTSDCDDMSGMFSGCSSLTSLDLSDFDTSKVTNMDNMFNRCSSLASAGSGAQYDLNLSGFDTHSVTTMHRMFADCSSLTNLDISGFDTSNVTSMSAMFNGCSSLTSLDVSGINTSNVTDMSYMFYGCSALTSAGPGDQFALNLAGMETGNVTTMSAMFNGCSGVTRFDLSGFNTSNVANMGSMFYNCSSLTNLDLSGFNTSNVTNMRTMFYNCSKLTSLNISGFDTSSTTDLGSMFNGCSNLTSITIGNAFNFHGNANSSRWAELPDKWRDHTEWYLSDEVHMSSQEMKQAGSVQGGTWTARYVREGIFAVFVVDQNDNILEEKTVDPFGWYYDIEIGEAIIQYPISLSADEVLYKCTNPDPDMFFVETETDEGPQFFLNPDYDPLTGFDWERMDPTNEISDEIYDLYEADRVYKIVRIVETPPDLNVTAFNTALLLSQNASVPSATVSFTAAPGAGIAAVPGTSSAVLAPTAENGVTGTPTVGSASFASGDATVTSAEGITIGANQKAVVKPVSVDFNGVAFTQPGIYRYLITEPSTGAGLIYDTQLADTTNGVRYQRVLDVYVIREDVGVYKVGGYVFHEVANAPAAGETVVADKSVGFVNEYDTKSITIATEAAGNQSSTEKYFAYTITMQNPNNAEFTATVDWSNAADALNPTENPATVYSKDDMVAANTSEWTSNADGSISKTIYLRSDQQITIDGVPTGTTYSVTVAEEDYGPSWTVGGSNGNTGSTGNRVLNAPETVSFTMNRDGLVPTGVVLSVIPGAVIMIGAIVAIVVMKKRKEEKSEEE